MRGASKPSRPLCGMLVAAPEGVGTVPGYADRAIRLETPDDSVAVGRFHRHLPRVEDHEAVALFASDGKPRAA